MDTLFLLLKSRFSWVAMLLAAWCSTAAAHPHVFVTAAATVNFEQGVLASITHVWSFDEFYTASALEGMPKNKDGAYGREELAELAKVNIDGLKEFGYFTFTTLGKSELKVVDPKPGDYWLEHKDGVLSLHFTLPFEKPAKIDAQEFALAIYDPSFFIAFELAAKDPVKLNTGAPANCKIEVGVPKPDSDAKKLGEAFFEQLGGSSSINKSILVHCAP